MSSTTIIDKEILDRCVDETLPPDHIKLLGPDDTATVFRLDLEDETATPVARWPEKNRK